MPPSPAGRASAPAPADEDSSAAGERIAPEAAEQAEILPLEEKAGPAAEAAPGSLPAWTDILRVCSEQGAPAWLLPLLRKTTAQWRDGRLVLTPSDPFAAQRLQDSTARDLLRAALAAFRTPPPPLDIAPPLRQETSPRSREELRLELAGHPLIQELERNFGARIIDCGRLR